MTTVVTDERLDNEGFDNEQLFLNQYVIVPVILILYKGN